MGDLWNVILLDPLLNGLIVISRAFFDNFGIAIIILTVIVRLLTLPLTLRQLKVSKVMAELQPRMKELQKKHGKEKEKLSSETMKLYKEYGVNPMGCILPMVIQFPIWIALYQSIMLALAATPEALFDLSSHLYPWSLVHSAVPLANQWLWLDLSKPDPVFVMPVLVAASMWVQQKMMTIPSPDPSQSQMNTMMQTMMPLMFGFLTLSFPSGLAIYWVASNIIGIVIQYFVTGWGTLKIPTKIPTPWVRTPQPAKAPAAATPTSTPAVVEKREQDGTTGDKRQDGRRSNRTRPTTTRGQPRPDRNRSRKQR
ncbi:MAG: YidC/Oxa1 family membrane protein insertase [Dehalococcoidia bacterium]|nr:YidC/Oxa1 family membrane protein insertase [Dehalococcoidia bacterium]